jgi:hypothetical protein
MEGVFKIAFVLACCLIITLYLMVWPGLKEESHTPQPVHNVEGFSHDISETSSAKNVHNKILLPKLSLEGILLTGGAKPSALIKVNNKSSIWFRAGDEIQDGLFVFEVEKNRVTLKKDMAYYKLTLVDL